jgi:hypothetical protein
VTYEVLKILNLDTLKDKHTKVNDYAIKSFLPSTSNYNENTNVKPLAQMPNEKA